MPVELPQARTCKAFAANIVQTRSVVAHNKGQVDKVERLKETLLSDIKAGVGDKEAIRHTMNGQDFGLSLVSPSLQREQRRSMKLAKG